MLYNNNSYTDLLGFANVFISKKEVSTSKITIYINIPVSPRDCTNFGTLTSRVYPSAINELKESASIKSVAKSIYFAK